MNCSDSITREGVAKLDADDSLARRRDLFHVPDGEPYPDGNFLGAMPKPVPQRMSHAKPVIEASSFHGD